MESDEELTLTDLKIGEEAFIVGFRPGFLPHRRKLLAMGLTPHTPIRLIRKAPLGDPLELEVRGCLFSLRKREANALKVARNSHDLHHRTSR
ncbi:MAG TPA: FeoA family protein [Coxiellaceae bacterium]|nr:FeoA family protein [Coxiellaceae bacterium]